MPRKLSAHYIFPGDRSLFKKGIITTSDEGIVLSISDTNDALSESENLEFYNGIITSGAVISQDHLEYSYLKDHIISNDPIANFLMDLPFDPKIQDIYPGQTLIREWILIQEKFSHITISDLVYWSIVNGTKATGKDMEKGFIKKGNKSGLILITDINFQEMKLTSHSEVKMLL